MKAYESHPKFPSKLRECTNYAVREIKKVCRDIGPRVSGEEAERKAQAYVAQSMARVSDTVESESFAVHPKAFMAWVAIDGTLMLISVLFCLLALLHVYEPLQTVFSAAALVCTVVSIVLIVTEFLLYKPFLDPIYPKREACNVACTRKAAGETKRRIVFCGHIDSANEWRYTYLGGGKLLKTVIYAGVGSLFVSLAVNIASFFALPEAARWILAAVQCLEVIPFTAVLFFTNRKSAVDGANDNLTGVFASMAVLHYLAANGIRFENTEVVALSTACEEAGLRGAKAYAKKHLPDTEDIETLVIATDTLRDFEHMCIYNKDMTGTVKLDEQGAKLMQKASENAEHPLPFASVSFGSSDAAAMQQGGMRAVTLAAMDPTPARYYHTRLDNADNLDVKTVETGIRILLEAAFLFDEQGLRDTY